MSVFFFFFVFICLFVCLFHMHLLLLFYPRQTSAGKHATFISCHTDNITCIEREYTFGRQRTGQCKCKHKPTNQNKRAQYGSLSQPEPLHLLCLPSLLAGVAIRSYNDRISFLPQGPLEAFCLWLEKYFLVGFWKNETPCLDTYRP